MAAEMTDKDSYQLEHSVTKSLMGVEMPLKVKHAKFITEIHRNHGSRPVWDIALKQPILENRISAWRFCHLLHKILREGHNLCPKESHGDIQYLTELGKLWSPLTIEGYGICILKYTKLLILKIEFHLRNQKFPGTLKMSNNEIEQIGIDDINVVFQLTTEIFDYLDAIIDLQATVFKSLKSYNINSMTSTGQCRVAALIPCIEDSNPLYDFSIRFMFKLHKHLPNDTLEGHRQRFSVIFNQLRSFYQQSNDLQYFVNLVTVPKLPGQLPNFLSNWDNFEYQPPNLVITEEPIIEHQNEMHSNDKTLQRIQQGKQIIEQKIQNQVSEISIVKDKLDKLLPLYMQTQEDYKNLLRQNEDNNNAMLKMKILYDQLENNKASVENELAELKGTQEMVQKMEAKKKEIDEGLAQKIQSLEEQNKDLIIKLQQSESINHQQNESFQKHSFNLYETKRENDQLKQKIMELTSIQNNLEQRVNLAITELNTKLSEIENLTEMNQSLGKETTQLEIEIDELKETTFELNKNCNVLRTQIDELKMCNVNLEESIHAERTTKFDLLMQKSSDYVELEKVYIELLGQKNQLANENETFKSMIGHLQTNQLHMKSKLEALEIIAMEKSNLTETVNKLTNNIDKIKEEKSKLVLQLGEQLGQLESKCNQYTNLEEELTTLQGTSTTHIAFLELQLEETVKKYDHISNDYEQVVSKKNEIENDLQSLLQHYKGLKKIYNEVLVEKTLMGADIEMLKSKTDQLQTDNIGLKSKLKALETCKSTLAETENKLTGSIKQITEEKSILVEQLEELHGQFESKCNQNINLEQELIELKAFNNTQIENDRQHLLEQNQELKKAYNEVLVEKTQLETEIETYKLNYSELESKIEALKICKSTLIKEIENEKSKLAETENKLTHNITQITEEKSLLLTQLGKLRDQVESKHNEYSSLEEELITLKRTSTIKYDQIRNDHERVQSLLDQQKQQLNTIKTLNGATLDALLQTCIKSAENLTERTIFDSDTTKSIGTITYFMIITEELTHILAKFKLVYENYISDNTNVEGLVRRLISSGHLFSVMHLLGIIYSNNSSNMEKGETNIKLMKKFCRNVLTLYQLITTKSNRVAVDNKIEELQYELHKIVSRVNESVDCEYKPEELSDLIEIELNTMDKSIEEAAKLMEDMMEKSKKSDSGINLEVNEKILDSCTNLIKAIGMLLKKSRGVQAEIMAQAKGASTAKEFYKRNHQWTEGMISAAKSVAQGAKFLVDAANKAVSGEDNHQHDLMVAAQEITASTAQLVVASRVKAPSGSHNLKDLNEASKQVTLATGGVVAVVRDCNKKLEEQDDFVNSQISVNHAKKLEFEIQGKILELDQSLQIERRKLSTLRKQNYTAK